MKFIFLPLLAGLVVKALLHEINYGRHTIADLCCRLKNVVNSYLANLEQLFCHPGIVCTKFCILFIYFFGCCISYNCVFSSR